MQNAALEAAGLDDWSYEAIDVDPDDFVSTIRRLPGEGFVGVNVTVPHKEAAIRVAGEASDSAIGIGAANTLSFEAGRVRADNTDAPGLIDALELPTAATGSAALVLGAGGAGRAVVWALRGAGAEVTLWNRTRARALSLAEEFGVGVTAEGEQESIDPGRFDFIVNASSAGLADGDGAAALPLDSTGFRSGQVVVDMVYGNSPSTLLEAAGDAGAATVDGLEILVRQGARSFAIWTGREPDLEVMRRAARA